MNEIVKAIEEVAKELGSFRFDYDTRYRSDKDNHEHVVTFYFNDYLACSCSETWESALANAKDKAIKNKEEAIKKAKLLYQNELEQFKSKAKEAADSVNCPDVTVRIEMDTENNTEYSVFFRKDLRHVYYGEGSSMEEAISQALNDVNESLSQLCEDQEGL